LQAFANIIKSDVVISARVLKEADFTAD